MLRLESATSPSASTWDKSLSFPNLHLLSFSYNECIQVCSITVGKPNQELCCQFLQPPQNSPGWSNGHGSATRAHLFIYWVSGYDRSIGNKTTIPVHLLIQLTLIHLRCQVLQITVNKTDKISSLHSSHRGRKEEKYKPVNQKVQWKKKNKPGKDRKVKNGGRGGA